MRCLSCGREAPDSPFCEWCGKPLSSAAVAKAAAAQGPAVPAVRPRWLGVRRVAVAAVLCVAALASLVIAVRHRSAPNLAAGVPAEQLAASAASSAAAAPTAATTPPTQARQQLYDKQVASLDRWTAAVDERINQLPAAATDVAALARSLSQPQAAFAYVRDNIALEPYAGVLKGAQATLATRGGNDLDRALLLVQLLQNEGVGAAQIVHGQLSPPQVATLLAQIASKPDAVELIAGSLPKPSASASPDPKSLARSRRLSQTIADDYQVLQASLRSANLEVPTDDAGQQRQVLADHYWVRFTQDGKPVDLDPAFATAAFGQSFTAATESLTADGLRPDLFQKVSIVLTADYLQGGALHSEEALRGEFTAAELWGKNIRFVLTPAQQGKPGSVWQALLRVGDKLTTGQQVRIGGSGQAPPKSALADSGGGMLGGITGGTRAAPGAAGFGPIDSNDARAGDSAGPLARVRLTITAQAPGLPPSTTQKVILDRLAASQSSIDPAVSDELTRQLLTQVWDGIAAVGPVHPYFVLQNATLPWIHAVRDIRQKALAARYLGQKSDPSALPQGGLSPDLLIFTLASSVAEHALQSKAFPDLRAYYARPRLLFIRHGFGIADWSAPARVATYREGIDIANSPFAFVGSSQSSVALAMQWGIADTALEYELGASRGVAFNTVGLMSAAAQQKVAFKAVGAAQKTQLDSLGLPAPMRSVLEQELAAGNTLVTPSGFVPLAGHKTYGWWSVQPGGYAIGKMELGGSQAMTEHIELAENLSNWPKLFAELHGTVLACYFAASSSVLMGAPAADPAPCVDKAVCGAVTDFLNEEAWFRVSPSGGEEEEQTILEQLWDVVGTQSEQGLGGAVLDSSCEKE